MFKTLYSISAKGSARFWRIELDIDEAKYRTLYGTCDLELSTPTHTHVTGKVGSSAWRYSEPKNVGRANEMSASDQAMAESGRLITEKKKTGFFEYGTIPDEKFEVMLAYNWEDKRVTEGLMFLQPKLDGVRCYIILKTLEAKSRKHNTLPKIEEKLRESITYISPEFNNLILDGEIYQHGKDIGEIISSIRLGIIDNDDISFNAFDIIDLSNPLMPYSDRLKLLTHTVATLKPMTKNFIKQVETEVINVEPQDIPSVSSYIDLYHDIYASRYEGLIIRFDAPYKFGRSTSLLKYKKMMTREFEVVDLIEGDGNSSNLAASAIVRVSYTEEDLETFSFLKDLKDPVFCGISVKGKTEIRRSYLQNKDHYIGKFATVCFQSFIDPTGMIRFGELVTFRDYE